MPSPFGRRPWCVLACLHFISIIAVTQPNPPAGPKSVNVEPHGIVVNYPRNWRALGRRYTNLVEVASEQLAWPESENKVPAERSSVTAESLPSRSRISRI